MYFNIITFFHILYVLIFINVYMVLFLFNNVIYVFLLLCLCILIICLCMATLIEGFNCFFFSCKANGRVKPAKTEARLAPFLNFVLFYVLFVLCHSVYCLCVYVYSTTATGWLNNYS
jgi:hypothetical protein